jgi:Na+-transporting NADH:ubiquinone oxidoreductase subunit NqrD
MKLQLGYTIEEWYVLMLFAIMIFQSTFFYKITKPFSVFANILKTVCIKKKEY